MSPAEQQAESRKYGNDLFMVVPLDEGFAIYNAARQLQFIISGFDHIVSRALKPIYESITKPELKLPKAITLEDLGL